jgi:hypothetical protein
MIFAKDRDKQKAEMKKNANTFEKTKVSDKSASVVGEPVPVYLIDQTVTRTANVLTNRLKHKRMQRAGK